MRRGLAGLVVCSLAVFGCGGDDDDGSGTPCEDEIACNGCTSDQQCVDHPDFGPDHLCIDGECVAGNCRDDSDCSGGQLCDDDTRLCRACVDTSEDDRCGEDAACIDGVCTAMACNVDEQCTEPNLCVDHHCGCAEDATCDGGLCIDNACADCGGPSGDADCVTAYGAGRLCVEGHCIAGDCRVDGECGGGSICCSNNCAGNDCCGVGDDEHCDAIIPGFVCNASAQCVCPDRPDGTVIVSEDGDDGQGNGSPTCPVRSLSRALAIATSDPTPTVSIEVAAGTYGSASGGSFPLLIDRSGIAISGAGPEVTIVDNDSGASLLRIDQAVTVSGLRLNNNGTGASVLDVRAGGTISDTLIAGAGDVTTACVAATSGAAMTLAADVTLGNCQSGVTAASGGQLTIAATVSGNQVGVTVNSGGVVTLTGAVQENISTGVQFNDSAVTNGTSQINGATITGNGGDGVGLTLNSRVRIRNSVIVSNVGSGVRATGASVQIDLGTLADAGGNTLNQSSGGNGGVGLCNLTGRTLDAVADVWSTCPPSADAGCSGGADLNTAVNAASCSSQ